MAAFVTGARSWGWLSSGRCFWLCGRRARLAGGLIGAMTTRGLESELADFFDQAVVKGKVLVAGTAGKGRRRS